MGLLLFLKDVSGTPIFKILVRTLIISVLALHERPSIFMDSDKISLAESLEGAVLLLSKNRWIYDFKLTRFFLDRVWESIPEEVSSLVGLQN